MKKKNDPKKKLRASTLQEKIEKLAATAWMMAIFHGQEDDHMVIEILEALILEIQADAEVSQYLFKHLQRLCDEMKLPLNASLVRASRDHH